MATKGRVLGAKYKLTAESADSACSVCTKKNRTGVVKFCIDCNDHYCSSCTEANEDGKGHSSHNVTESHVFSTTQDDTISGTDTCGKHPGKLIDTICKSHDELCCFECVNQDHGTCTKITISEGYKELVDNGTEEKILKKLKSIKEQLIETIQLHENVKKVLLEEKDKITRDVREFRRKMEQMLEDLERETITTFTARSEQIETEFRKNAETAERHLSNIVKYEEKLVKQNVSTMRTFIALKDADNQLKVSQSAGEKCLLPPVRKIDFKPNAKIQAILQDSRQLGTCHFFSYPVAPFGISTERTPNENRLSPGYTICSSQIVSDVEVEGDENECEVSGMCITPDGTVILVDQDNNKLKRLEKQSYKVLDFINLEKSPLGICSVSNAEVMVSMGQTIQRASLSTKMEIIETLNFSHECQFLQYHDDKIFVSDGSDVIRLYSSSGTLLREICTDMTVYGFVCSEDGNMIYIGSESELSAVDVHGAVAWTCSGEALGIREITGICLDNFGNVMVCGANQRLESNDLVTYVNGVNGETDGSFDGGLEHYYLPSSVCFDRHNVKLIVANSSGSQLLINDIIYNKEIMYPKQ